MTNGYTYNVFGSGITAVSTNELFGGPLGCFANEMVATGMGAFPISEGRPMPTWVIRGRPGRHDHPEYAPVSHDHPHQHPEYQIDVDDLIERLREGPTPNEPSQPEPSGEPVREREPVIEGTTSYRELIDKILELSTYKGEANALREMFYKENIRGYAEKLFKGILDSDKPAEEKLPIYKAAVFIGTRAMLANSAYRNAMDDGADPYETLGDFLGLGSDEKRIFEDEEIRQYVNEAMKKRTGENANKI